MEILHNLVYSFTSEQPIIIYFFTIPCTFLESFIMLNLFTSFLKIPCTKEQSLMFTCAFAIPCILAFYFIPSPFYTIFDYIIMFVLIKKIFKLSYFKSTLSIICSFFIYSLVGNLVLNPFLKILNLSFDQVNNIPIYRLLYVFVIYSILALIIVLVNIKKIYINLLDHLSKPNKKTLITNLIFAFITLSVQLIISFYHIDNYSIFFTLLNFISLFAYFFVSITSLNRIIRLQLTTNQLQIAEHYNNTLSALYDSVRGFKHDFNNMIDILGGYIKRNDLAGLNKYYSDLRKDCVRVNNAELLNPNIINNPGIYSLIVSKQQKATDLKTIINLEVFFDFNNLHMPIYEFSRILGILLDNAIEAASMCEDKHVNLMFRESRKDHTQIICVENTYTNKDIDTKTIFEKGVTGKKDHMGIGLWKVNQIVMEHNNIVLHTSKDETYFKQQLEIYY